MNNVLGFLEAKLMPLAAKAAQQRHLCAIRGAYVSFMPFIIVGSILLVISSFPNQGYQQFMAGLFGASWSNIIEIPFNAVFSTMSLFVSFLTAYRLAEHYDEDRVSSGILSLVCFLILTPFIKVEALGNVSVIPTEWIGSKGLFVAMIGSLLWTELFCYLKRRKLIIKMPEGVPPAVQESFAALLPALFVIILVLAIRILFEHTSYEIVRRMQQGMTPQQAADSVVFELEDRLIARFGRVGDLSVVCMNRQGEFGISTNIKTFSFVVASAILPPTVYLAERRAEHTHFTPASEQWLAEYAERIRAPIEEIHFD